MNDLISREAVLKLIIDTQYKLNCDLSALILDVAEMPTSSGWISTKDRLPETGTEAEGKRSDEVLIVCHGERIEVGYYYEYGVWETDTAVYADDSVTHWQPLPEPPEKGDNDE